MVLKKRALVIYVATMLVSPALAETLNLKVESGAITGITDRQTGQLVLYITEESSRDLADFTERHVGKKIDILVGEKLVGSPPSARQFTARRYRLRYRLRTWSEEKLSQNSLKVPPLCSFKRVTTKNVHA